MLEALAAPWPWYVAGPLIGLIVPLLLIFGGKVFGLSANLRHLCAAMPTPERLKPGFFRYDWRHVGGWNLMFIAGMALGGFLTVVLLGVPDAGASISPATQADLAALGITDVSGLVPADLISWDALGSPAGMAALIVGGFLLGFGARWAGGCTSGHAISGLADFQMPSLVAVAGFFIGGLFVTHVLLPLLLA